MAKHIQTQTEWESTMARRIMDQLRGELYLDQRYLNAALGALPPAPLPPGTTGAAFAADGARLCYPPAWVLATYRKTGATCPGLTCTACCTASSATCGCGAAATAPCGGWPATSP